MPDRVYVLSPEIRELLRVLDFEDEIPEIVEESYFTSETMGYPWTPVGVAHYFYYRCTGGSGDLTELAAMIGADFALQMERSARARQLDTSIGSLRCLYESSQESLEQNSLSRDIAKLRAVIQDLLPGGSRAVQVGSELHEALENLCSALKVDIYAPPETMNGADMERSAPIYFNDPYVVTSSKSFGFIFNKGAFNDLVVEPVDVVEDGSVTWLEALNAEGKE